VRAWPHPDGWWRPKAIVGITDAHVAADPGLVRGGADPRGDRFGHRGHDHRLRHRGPIVSTVGGVRPELLVLATGAGSLILSHVNDGGFWLVKEYFNMTVPQTFKTWTVMETLVSVLACCSRWRWRRWCKRYSSCVQRKGCPE
jgi:hypothetical protein